jgi:hypothetical protein
MGANMIFHLWTCPTNGLRLVIGLHTGSAPTNDEWGAYLAAVKHTLNRNPENVRGLSLSDGGAPSSIQRSGLNTVLNGRHIPVSVISDSVVVRGIVTALNWFNGDIKAFAPHSFEEALSYLNVPREANNDLWKAMKDMDTRLTTDIMSKLRLNHRSL